MASAISCCERWPDSRPPRGRFALMARSAMFRIQVNLSRRRPRLCAAGAPSRGAHACSLGLARTSADRSGPQRNLRPDQSPSRSFRESANRLQLCSIKTPAARYPDPEDLSGRQSAKGGNRACLMDRPAVLLADEPSQVGRRRRRFEIYSILRITRLERSGGDHCVGGMQWRGLKVYVTGC